eukprot:513915-Amphidinium_carterae.1
MLGHLQQIATEPVRCRALSFDRLVNKTFVALLFGAFVRACSSSILVRCLLTVQAQLVPNAYHGT